MEPLDDFGVGQFINDGSSPEISKLEFKKAIVDLNVYLKKSLKAANAEVSAKTADFWFVASRDVAAGSEILTHYGFEFWLTKFLLERTGEPEWRFLFYSLLDQNSKPFDLRKFYEYDDDTCRIFLEVLIGANNLEGKQDAKKIIYRLTDRIKVAG